VVEAIAAAYRRAALMLAAASLLVSIANALNATLYKKLNFNFIREIAPVASIGGAPYVMVINPSVPAKLRLPRQKLFSLRLFPE
jgi:ribosomal protein S18 acetylase RimI-like enzyme